MEESEASLYWSSQQLFCRQVNMVWPVWGVFAVHVGGGWQIPRPQAIAGPAGCHGSAVLVPSSVPVVMPLAGVSGGREGELFVEDYVSDSIISPVSCPPPPQTGRAHSGGVIGQALPPRMRLCRTLML